MPKFRYTRVVTNYTFTPPQNISEADYNTLKNLFKINPHADIGGLKKEMEEDRKDNEKMNTILTIGLICFFIGLLAMLSSDNNQWGFILMFLSLVFSIHPIINTGILQSSKNKASAFKDKQAYFTDLKKMIINSSNYKNFSKDYGKKYNPFYIDQEKYFKDAFPGLKYKPND